MPTIFSVIVIAPQSSTHLLPFTLASILEQDYPDFETILVEEGTLEGDFPRVKRVVSQGGGPFSMMNQAAQIAEGEYLHFLLAGEFYLSKHALAFLADFAEKNLRPDLISTGSIIRHSLSPPEILFETMSPKRLKRGSIAPTLQSFYFRRETFLALKGFRKFYTIQNGFDLLCRFFLAPSLRKAFFKRVLTDYEYRRAPASKIIRSFLEALLILFLHFGLSPALLAWLAKNQLRLLNWFWQNIKGAFWKEKPSEIV